MNSNKLTHFTNIQHEHITKLKIEINSQIPDTYAENPVPMIPNDSYMQQPASLPPMTTTTSQIDQEFSQINQQFQDLSLQYQHSSYEYGSVATEQQQQQQQVSPQGQSAEVNSIHNYADQTNQYLQSNAYEQNQQMNYYGQQQQPLQQQQQPQIPLSGNISSGYGEQQSYQQQVNDQLAYEAPNYGTNEVNLPN